MMKNNIVRILGVLATAALLTGGVGCGEHKTTSRMTTSSTHGRYLSATIDGRAKFRTQGDDHIITFDRHELVVKKELLLVDGDKKSFGIPPEAKKVEIEVNKNTLTLSVDGSLLVKTPI